MPKKIDIRVGIRLNVYVYMCSHSMTYEKGAAIFGFNSKQAFHAWMHSKFDSDRDQGIQFKLDELTE